MIGGLVLASQVHAVIADDRAVFLDVSKDRYFKLGISQTELLKNGRSPARDRLVRQLVQKGLVRDAGGNAIQECLPRHPDSLIWRSDSTLLGVVGACRWADRALRSRRFADIVQWARHARAESADANAGLVSRFLSRRPFFSRDYNCLFDSLALTRFLRVRGVAGDWVFGVRGAPFAAHCWVQVEGNPVNDEAGFVTPYAPILVL